MLISQEVYYYHGRTFTTLVAATMEANVTVAERITLPDGSFIEPGATLAAGTTLPAGTKLPVLMAPYTLRKDGLTDSLGTILLELNTMAAGLIGYNAFGQLQVDPSQDDVTDDKKPVLWAFGLSEAEFYGSVSTMNNSMVYNEIIVTGAALAAKTARAHIVNTDPRSPFNAQTIGRKLKPRQETTSDQYTSDEQCLDIAKWMMKRDSIMRNTVSLSCTQLFHLYENGLVSAPSPKRGNQIERYLIVGYDLPMGASGDMSINAASVQDIQDLAYEHVK